LEVPSLQEFVIQNDLALFNIPEDDSIQLITDPTSPSRPRKQLSTAPAHTPLYTLMSLSDVTIANAYSSIAQFHACLNDLNLINGERLRPSWDTYFMHLSDLAARRSNCMKRRVGCILVKDSRVIATGYNGTPKGLRNCNEGGCQRCNEATPCGTGLDRCLCMHAEENALLEAGRERVGRGQGVILYCNTCPCLGKSDLDQGRRF
jgi:dCMP deaminase